MSAIDFNHRLQTRDLFRDATLVGCSALIVGNVTAATAFVVGGTYALVDSITKPFFRNTTWIISFFCNTALTTSLVNQFSGYSLSMGRVAYITYLPLIAIVKMIAIGLVALFIISHISRYRI